jgi:hypothetical protein
LKGLNDARGQIAVVAGEHPIVWVFDLAEVRQAWVTWLVENGFYDVLNGITFR